MRSHPDVECAALAANASAERRAAIKLMKEMGLRPEERAYELQNWPETGARHNLDKQTGRIPEGESMKESSDKVIDDPGQPRADSVLEMQGGREAPATCALLTPAIQARLKSMAAGQVLEVRVDDPTASEDIASWARLTRNELLAVVTRGPVTHYYLRKRQG